MRHNFSAMFIFVTFIILGGALAGLNYYGLHLYEQWYWFWTIPLFWLLYFLALAATYIIILYFVSLCIARDKEKVYAPSKPTMWIIKQTAFLILKTLRVKINTSGMGKLPSKKVPLAIMHNHLSMFDEFVLAAVLRVPLIFISKPSNLRIPIAGSFMRKAGYLPIIQGDMADGNRVINHAINLIKEGNSVVIAPEGTRNKDFPEPVMLPFHPGSFRLATGSKSPIALFAIQNTNAISKRFPYRTQVYCDCVGLIEPEEYENMSSNELSIHCYGLIARRLEQKKARFYHLKRKKNEEE